MTIGYATVGANDLEKARTFFDELLKQVDLEPLFDHPSGGRVYGRDGRIVFGVLGPFDKQPATNGNGTMISFTFETPEQVNVFHARALELGAKNEGSPGFRGDSPFYMSYFRDLDGNKFCAYHQAERL